MKRRGFTLVESLVVAGVVMTSASLTAPRIQSVREAARKTQCLDHLHNLGIAIHNYCEANSEYIPFGWVAHSHKADSKPHYGWAMRLLPYMEQRNLYDQINYKTPTFAKLGKTVIRAYRCPSDTMPKLSRVRGGWAAMSYSGVYGSKAPPRLVEGGVAKSWAGKPDTRKDFSGVMGINKGVTLSNITNSDGTANTAMVGERCVTSGGGIWIGVRGNEYESDVVTASPFGDAPNMTRNSFSSRHPGGANMLMCDGAVKFVSNKINTGTGKQRGIWQNIADWQDNQVNTNF